MKRHLNLLPWPVQRRLMLRVRLRQWALAYAVAAIAFFGLYVRECYLLSQARASQIPWQNRAAAIQAVEDHIKQNQQQLRQLKKQLAAYGHLASDQCGFELIAAVSRGISRCPDQIQVQNMGFVRRTITETLPVDKSAPPPPPNTPPKTITKESRVLQLRGVATNHLAISHFVSSLRDCTAFQKVELRASQSPKSSKPDDYRGFQVECTF